MRERMSQVSIGNRVRVPWGLGSIEGIVRGIHGPRGHLFALVALPESSGEDEEATTVSVPLSDLQPKER
jgi:hypothetical protein